MRNPRLTSLSNRDLVSEIERLARSEHPTCAALVAHLAELHARRLYLEAGFPNLFEYCVAELRFSESEAYNRVVAAEAAARFPVLLDCLADGSITLTTIRLLAPYLTRENCDLLVAEAAGKRKTEVQEILARRFPRPDVPASIRKLPDRTPSPSVTLALSAPAAPPLANYSQQAAAPSPPLPAARPPLVAPLAPDRYEFRFTATTELRDMVQLAREMLGHAVPSGDLAEIFQRGMKLLLEDLARKKFAATDRPRPGRGTRPDSRYIRAEVRRAVWVRDLGRCAFVSRDGRRCTEKKFIEFHHLDPYALGGEATVENISLRCGRHNRYEGEIVFGRRDSKTGGASVVKEAPAPYGGGASILRSGTGVFTHAHPP